MTLTREEMEARGWPEGMIAGGEQMLARLAEIDAEIQDRESAPAAEDLGPKLGTPGWEAERLARSLLEADAAHERMRRAQQPVPEAEAIDTPAMDKRARALAQAARAEPATVTREITGEPMLLANGAMVLCEMKNGMISRMHPAAFPGRVILPQQWEEQERRWRRETRRRENEMLARYYGADLCVAEGLFTEAEAAEMDPEKSRHVVLPPGVEAL